MRTLPTLGPLIAVLALVVTTAVPRTVEKSSESSEKPQPVATEGASLAAAPINARSTTASVPVQSSDEVTAVGLAASYAVEWYSINGGGTLSASSTHYRMGASIGQSVAGAASSPSYQMRIGFWYGAGGACDCRCKYDPQCDAVISDVMDVTLTINRAFRGAVAVQDPGCPVERTDMDASSATDVIDVTKAINVAFRGQTVAANYVDPCL